jgi:glycosyltransferase involved in cell wall biosynthesis
MKKVLLVGPLLTRSGYGEQARFALRALRSRPDLFDVYIQPLTWGQTSWMYENTSEREWIDQTIEKTIGFTANGGTFDTCLQITIPNEWSPVEGATNVGYTAGIETTRVAHQWLEKGNQMDRIIVVSNHSKDVYENTVYDAIHEQTKERSQLRLQCPVDVVNYPVKEYDELPDLDFEVSTDFNFLTIAQWGSRKNLDNTIKWFVEEFHDDHVGLIVKTNFAKNCYMDFEVVETKLRNILSGFPDRKCKTYLLHGDMSDEEIHSAYFNEKTSAFLLLTHGEGFGLPLFEASYSGMPLITVGWSGQTDFLYDEDGNSCFYDVSFDLNNVQEENVWDGVVIKESMWSYAREQSAKKKMRECYEDFSGENKEELLNKTCTHAKYLCEKFNEDKMYNLFVESVLAADASSNKASVMVL